MSSRLFDAYIAVDWSSRNDPSPEQESGNAIWVGERDAAGSARETYVRTRWACREHLVGRLAEHVGGGRRVFLGFDFPYGYPEGFARSVGLTGDEPWKLLWRELQRLIVDHADNRNNRFDVAAELNARCGSPRPGPFWGHPSTPAPAALETHSPAYPYPVGGDRYLAAKRWAERRAPRTHPVWKLFTAGSVGSQALVGIPTVAHLRWSTEFADVSQVWPFETGFTPAPTPPQGPFILHAEIWPSMVSHAVDGTLIKDKAQVRAVSAWLAETDDAGTLGRLFDRPVDLPPEGVSAAVAEEGWFVGAGLTAGRGA